MKITSRSRVAIKILVEMAHLKEKNELVQRTELARKTHLSAAYVDQVLIKLRAVGIVESVRGPKGGLRLARPKNEIDVWSIFRAVEDKFLPVVCLDKDLTCSLEPSCEASGAWSHIAQNLQDSLENIKLTELVNKSSLPKVKRVSQSNFSEVRA